MTPSEKTSTAFSASDNRHAPQRQASLRAAQHPTGKRVTCYLVGVLILRYRAHGSLKGSLVDRHDLALITATDVRKSDPFIT
jgi:hypothetical protein